MTFRLRIRLGAERDLQRLYNWYETQAVGLGARLLHELESTYSVLEQTPLMYADIYEGTRRVTLRKYPVGVYYKIVDDAVHIVAISHLARSPAVWMKRK